MADSTSTEGSTPRTASPTLILKGHALDLIDR
jgi:hypothetical protein